MDKKSFFDKVDSLLEQLEKDKNNLPKTITLTIHYVSGEKESLEVDESVRLIILSATHKRNKYLYLQQTLINLDNVTKFDFKEIK
ncbi:hypothetical protein [Sporolactobacillus terrae]|uniref:hypothetical protein n=1 Tax=Sporolactobacillus terrae TaxID=269673 RepID=UPI001CBC749D|nr:hypothetical protein [Sporolactobacillus terrae]UAK17569.1 hypothetical protein K7399_06490 [Sporolactobacillus terrae]